MKNKTKSDILKYAGIGTKSLTTLALILTLKNTFQFLGFPDYSKNPYLAQPIVQEYRAKANLAHALHEAKFDITSPAEGYHAGIDWIKNAEKINNREFERTKSIVSGLEKIHASIDSIEKEVVSEVNEMESKIPVIAYNKWRSQKQYGPIKRAKNYFLATLFGIFGVNKPLSRWRDKYWGKSD